MNGDGKPLLDIVLEPVSGRAVTVMAGQTLRLEQVTGRQCIDFNCFSLHDYKEQMSVGMMRRRGFHARRGDYVISAPPRSRLILEILHVDDSCVIDTLGSRCSAEMFESSLGFEWHTNCQDTLAEAIREFGLTPDDTHDSLNFWMETVWDDEGNWTTVPRPGKPGDRVDLLALIDVLAVPVTCGSGDVSGLSNYSLGSARVQVLEATPNSLARVEATAKEHGRWRNQRQPSAFRNPSIKADRPLARSADYVPEYRRTPMPLVDVEVSLSEHEHEVMQRLVSEGYADSLGDGIRRAVFDGVRAAYVQPTPFADPVKPGR